MEQIRIEEQRRRSEEQAARQLEEQRKQKDLQRRKEIAAAQHFVELKSKYQVTEYRDSSPSSLLYKILVQLEEQEALDSTDISWLEQENLFQVIATFYEQELDKRGDKWNITRAGKYWRKAGNPQRTLTLTEGVVSPDRILVSAVWTTRGAAFRDLSELSEAEHCAFSALKYNPDSYYTYNLLGAVYYQKGQPEQGDNYFQKAVELGASPTEQIKDIKSALDNSGAANRKRVAEYLLRKDPVQYRWAEYYLK